MRLFPLILVLTTGFDAALAKYHHTELDPLDEAANTAPLAKRVAIIGLSHYS